MRAASAGAPADSPGPAQRSKLAVAEAGFNRGLRDGSSLEAQLCGRGRGGNRKSSVRFPFLPFSLKTENLS